MLPELEFIWRETSLSIHTYTLFILLSMGLGLLLMFWQLRRVQLSAGQSLGFCLAVGIGFVTGARLLNYALNDAKYRQLGISIIEPQLGYFSLYGGILLAAAVLYCLVKYNCLDIKSVFDGLTWPFLLSFSLMKIGCFLNGCCYGTRTSAFFGVSLPLAETQKWASNSFVTKLLSPEQIRVYPVQLMEALAALAIMLMLFSFRKQMQKGSTFFAAAFLFSAARLLLLNMRSTDYTPFIMKQMYPALYLAIMVFSLLMFIKNERSNRSVSRGRGC